MREHGVVYKVMSVTFIGAAAVVVILMAASLIVSGAAA